MFKDEHTSDDICIPSLFESSDVLNLKFNAVNSNFTYLYDLYFDNDEHFIEPYISIFDIHSINTEPFNLDTDENPRILHISKDVIPEEMRELEKILTKAQKYFLERTTICLASTRTLLSIIFRLRRDTCL